MSSGIICAPEVDMTVSSKDSKELVIQAITANKTPINGCPKCKTRNKGNARILKYFFSRMKEKALIPTATIVGAAFAILIVQLISGKMSAASFNELSLTDTFSEFVLAACMATVALIWGFWSIIYKRSYGLWVCIHEGFLFENIELLIPEEMNCPSCNNRMRIIRDVRIID